MKRLTLLFALFLCLCVFAGASETDREPEEAEGEEAVYCSVRIDPAALLPLMRLASRVPPNPKSPQSRTQPAQIAAMAPVLEDFFSFFFAGA